MKMDGGISDEKFKKRLYISLAIIGGIIVLGFIIGAAVRFMPACTRMMCYPPSDSTGMSEVICNSCSYSDLIFATGIINVYKQCAMKEILIFNGLELIGTKYSEPELCEYKMRFFN